MTTSPVVSRFGRAELASRLQEQFGTAISLLHETEGADLLILVRAASILPAISRFLFWEAGGSFGGLIVEEWPREWNLRYIFQMPGECQAHVIAQTSLDSPIIPSIVAEVHAADWYEREAEDLFGLTFEGHPRLGNFVLHDEDWREAIAPMRKSFPAARRISRADDDAQPRWQSTLVVRDPGAFAMPVGPVYEGGLGESVHFLLETVGEDVIRAVPRLFYKYRGIEKIAEGKTIEDALLLAERFAATSSFAHSLAFCQAVENGTGIAIPDRARRLRVALAELERLRHHAGSIEGICQSTALNVSEAQAAIVEEQLLRASCMFTGHRYLFGLNTPGGLRRDFTAEECGNLLAAVDSTASQLRVLERRLKFSSSFLDRLENVGVVTPERARDLDLVGPVGRASGVARDLRRAYIYGGYCDYDFAIPSENRGDGYARLRVLFAEAEESARIIRQAVSGLAPGAVCAPQSKFGSAAAAGWVEAPIGAALHWVRLDSDGRIERYRILSPSFRNWLGFHVAVEDFAFQDFPIILATFALSASECDR